MAQINVLLALTIIVGFLAAIVLHEWSHALMASWLGDPTPQAEGRQTLSLASHIDPVGLILCVVLAFQPGAAIGLGWGKPVKADPWKLRAGTNVGILLVALAGPVFSLLLGVLTAIVLRFIMPLLPPNFLTGLVVLLFTSFAIVNISLAIFNLIPLYPLDGYQILYTLLPSKQAIQYSRWAAPYGPFILLAYFFLLPFLASLAGLGGFPLFHLGAYIWLAASIVVHLIGSPEMLDRFLQFLGIVSLSGLL
jgi:Zn-dependent protease